MALLCQSIKCPYPRAGAGALARELRAGRSPLEGGVSPRARRTPLEGGVSPRARRNLLEGAFDWATPVGRGGHRSVGRALCARLVKRCVLLLFVAGFRQDSPGFLGDPQRCPRQMHNLKWIEYQTICSLCGKTNQNHWTHKKHGKIYQETLIFDKPHGT
jgi:predicted amidophosphoribosyltransferase